MRKDGEEQIDRNVKKGTTKWNQTIKVCQKRDTWDLKGVQLYMKKIFLNDRGHWDKTLRVEVVRHNVEKHQKNK
jgi:hypothetical protein